MQSHAFRIRSFIVQISSVSEVTLRDAHLARAADTPGFAPGGSASSVFRGQSNATHIAGGDVRIFRIKLASKEQCELLPSVPARPNPRGIAMKLDQNSISDVREAILLRPSFRQHFDSVVVDWRYLEGRTSTAVALEGRWLYMRNISVIVDFT